jgi:hypothetical protein
MKQGIQGLSWSMLVMLIASGISAVHVLSQTPNDLPQRSINSVNSVRLQRNIELLDTLARYAADTLRHRYTPQSAPPLQLAPNDTLRYALAPHAGSWLLDQHLPTIFRPLRRFRSTDSGIATVLNLRLADCVVRYSQCDHDAELLTREAQVLLIVGLERSSGEVLSLPSVSCVYRDTLARAALGRVESRQYEFANGIVPEPPATFWKSVMEPLVVIGAAVVTLVLLFTVRTQ